MYRHRRSADANAHADADKDADTDFLFVLVTVIVLGALFYRCFLFLPSFSLFLHFLKTLKNLFQKSFMFYIFPSDHSWLSRSYGRSGCPGHSDRSVPFNIAVGEAIHFSSLQRRSRGSSKRGF